MHSVCSYINPFSSKHHAIEHSLSLPLPYQALAWSISAAVGLITFGIGAAPTFRSLVNKFSKMQTSRQAHLTTIQINNLRDKNLYCHQFKLQGPADIHALYQTLPVQRDTTTFREEYGLGGVGTVGSSIYQANPNAKIGIMIAANSGLPGGRLGYDPGHVRESDLSLSTQEESVWANVILTECGYNLHKQEELHWKTIDEKWGMANSSTWCTDKMTLQGIDFTEAENTSAYNGVYVVSDRSISALEMQDDQLTLKPNSAYPALIVFADSVNAGDAGSRYGTMQRTKNSKATNDYQFFKDCIQEKLRSALDAMAAKGITHPLVAALSTGIYAGSHKSKIQMDFHSILQNVLNEVVGPHRERRGQYFQDVVIPLK